MGVPQVKVRRLKRRQEFLRVASARRKWATPSMVVQASRFESDAAGRRDTRLNCGSSKVMARKPIGITKHQDTVGVGFTASRKIGSAVARNRAKRRLRAAADEVVPRIAAPGHDLVLIARGGTLTRPFPDLIDDLEQALRRLGVARSQDKGRTQGARARQTRTRGASR